MPELVKSIKRGRTPVPESERYQRVTLYLPPAVARTLATYTHTEETTAMAALRLLRQAVGL